MTFFKQTLFVVLIFIMQAAHMTFYLKVGSMFYACVPNFVSVLFYVSRFFNVYHRIFVLSVVLSN